MVFSTFQYLLSAHLHSKLAFRREKVSCRVQYRSRTSHDQTLQMKIDFPKIHLCFSGNPSNRLVLRGYSSSVRFGQNHCFDEIRGSKLEQLREHPWQNSGPTGKDRQRKYPLVKLKLKCHKGYTIFHVASEYYYYKAHLLPQKYTVYVIHGSIVN